MYSLDKEGTVAYHTESEHASISVSTFCEGLNVSCAEVLCKALLTNQFLRKLEQKVLC